jgi:hypothetical protein
VITAEADGGLIKVLVFTGVVLFVLVIGALDARLPLEALPAPFLMVSTLTLFKTCVNNIKPWNPKYSPAFSHYIP